MQVQPRATISIPFHGTSWYIHRQHDMNVYIHFMGFSWIGKYTIARPMDPSWVPYRWKFLEIGGGRWQVVDFFDVFATFFWYLQVCQFFLENCMHETKSTLKCL